MKKILATIISTTSIFTSIYASDLDIGVDATNNTVTDSIRVDSLSEFKYLTPPSYEIFKYKLDDGINQLLIAPEAGKVLPLSINITPNGNIEFENQGSGNYRYEIFYIIPDGKGFWKDKRFIISGNDKYNKIPEEDVKKLEESHNNKDKKEMFGNYDIKINISYKKQGWWPY